jgi:hypothetical protein
MKYQRICPKCNKIIYSKSKFVIDEAIKNNRLCFSCAKIKYKTENEKRIASNERRKKCVDKKTGIYIRNCPVCSKELICKTIYEMNRQNKQQRKCISCAAKLKVFSNEHRKNLSIANTGKKPNDDTREKMRNSRLGKKHSDETKKKIAEGNRGKQYSVESIRKMRISTLELLENTVGQISPRYNPVACKAIDEYGKLYGYNFQHAMNGGEFYIKELGYWVDGYDKEKNVVIEYYETYHARQIERDTRRKEEIIKHLNCDFIILKEDCVHYNADGSKR